MVSDAELEALFLQEGYVKTGRLQYKALFSNMYVRHYVEMERSIRDRKYFPGRVRVGNDEISTACATLWSMYSGAKIAPSDRATFDTISQIFLNIDVDRKFTSAGALRSEPLDNIAFFLREKVTPLLCPIDSLDALYRITLDGDGTPFRWLGGTAAVRSIQAIILAKKLDASFAEVTSTLEARRTSIERSIYGQQAESFFDFIWSNTSK
jgi:hypothetical protein